MPELPLHIESLGTIPGLRVLKLEGPLTVTNCGKLQSQISADPASSLIIDLSDVPFIDSTGIGCLVNGYVSHQNAGRSLCLVGVSDRVRICLRVANVEQLFPMFASIAEAERNAARL